MHFVTLLTVVNRPPLLTIMRPTKRSCSRSESADSMQSAQAGRPEAGRLAAHAIDINDAIPAHDCTASAACPLRAAIAQLLKQLLSALAHCLTSLCMPTPPPLANRKRTVAQRDLAYCHLPPASSLRLRKVTRQTPAQLQQQQLVERLRLVAAIYALLYTHSRKERQTADSKNDAKLAELVSEKEQQLSKLREDLTSRHKAELKAAFERMESSQEQCRVLSMKMEQIESVNAQYSIADSGSYEDSAATPPLLQSAADSAKEAMAICASDFFSVTRKHSVSINLPFLRLGDANCSPAPRLVKIALQAFLCSVLFQGFESSCNIDGVLFEKPNQSKQKLFQDFIRYRYMDNDKLMKENAEFYAFSCSKAESVAAYFQSLLLFPEEDNAGALVCAEIWSNQHAFCTSFLRLAKAVWLLRKLVFAFQPSAEVFRVWQGSGFDEEFMENVGKCEADECSSLEDDAGGEKVVKLMCVPGFTVRNTVIKSWVYLSHNEKQLPRGFLPASCVI